MTPLKEFGIFKNGMQQRFRTSKLIYHQGSAISYHEPMSSLNLSQRTFKGNAKLVVIWIRYPFNPVFEAIQAFRAQFMPYIRFAKLYLHAKVPQ